ncbi:hypothetical protein [Rugamonas sp.]|uniref:hypothetical protein n=1 Tax=Rugamonas sp. TaxID=1926287 RepID=UPI0025CE00C3|nr:hypothetical protein [Rugamonas sp.]
MNIEEAKQVMEGVPSWQRGALDTALERYKRFSGIYTMGELADELAADRATYPNLLKFSDGMPVLNDERCVEFMVAVSGLPAAWCAAWNEIDFMDEHADQLAS